MLRNVTWRGGTLTGTTDTDRGEERKANVCIDLTEAEQSTVSLSDQGRLHCGGWS